MSRAVWQWYDDGLMFDDSLAGCRSEPQQQQPAGDGLFKAAVIIALALLILKKK